MPELKNRKWELFCQEYIIDFNATRAYLRAGYKANEKTAGSNSSLLMARPEIQARISEIMSEREQRTEITQDKVLQELAKIAFANPTDEALRLKVSDKLIALDRLAKHLGMYVDKEALELKKRELELKGW